MFVNFLPQKHTSSLCLVRFFGQSLLCFERIKFFLFLLFFQFTSIGNIKRFIAWKVQWTMPRHPLRTLCNTNSRTQLCLFDTKGGY